MRQWGEQRHEVTVLERGYAYRGSRYASRSAIARLTIRHALLGAGASLGRRTGARTMNARRPDAAARHRCTCIHAPVERQWWQ
jgi:hypothetical protein